jgi:hypothetical protein
MPVKLLFLKGEATATTNLILVQSIESMLEDSEIDLLAERARETRS